MLTDSEYDKPVILTLSLSDAILSLQAMESTVFEGLPLGERKAIQRMYDRLHRAVFKPIEPMRLRFVQDYCPVTGL